MSRVCLVGLIAVFVGNVDLCAHDKAQKVFEQLSKDSELGSVP